MSHHALGVRLFTLVVMTLVGLACAAPPPPTPAPTAKPAPVAPTAAPTAAAKPAAPTAAAPAAAPTAVPKPTAAPAPTAAKALKKLIFTNNVKAPVPEIPHFYIPEPLGYFAEEGLAVSLTGSDGGGQSIQLLGNKQTDIVIGGQDAYFQLTAAGNKLPMKAVFGSNYRIIYQFGVKPDSPAKTAQDLKGKKIGVVSLAHAGLSYAKFALRNAGLDPEKDVEYVVVGQGAAAGNFLQKGDVDVLALWDVQYVALERLGIPVRVIPHPPLIDKIRAGHVFTVREDSLKENRDAFVGYLRAFAKGVAFMQTNPEAAVRIYFKMYPESVPTGIALDQAVANAVAGVKFRVDHNTYRIEGKPRGFMDIEAFKLYLDFLAIDGSKVDLNAYLDSGLIDDVNKFDEQKVRDQARSYKVQ